MLASDVYLIAGVALAALVCIALLYKELRLASFDAGFARVQGWPALLLDNVQMLLAALMTVIGLPAVGAVLMAAMLILPSVTMRFWTERLGTLLVGSSLLGRPSARWVRRRAPISVCCRPGRSSFSSVPSRS